MALEPSRLKTVQCGCDRRIRGAERGVFGYFRQAFPQSGFLRRLNVDNDCKSLKIMPVTICWFRKKNFNCKFFLKENFNNFEAS